MEFERDGYYNNDLQNLRDECKKCLYYHTTLKMKDGSTLDGIIENVDADRIIILVGEDVMEDDNNDENESNQHRQYYGYHQGHHPRRRYRRFRRRAFPLGALAALSLLPYPYVVPPYPYLPYYPYI